MSIDTATAELAEAIAERVAKLLSANPPLPAPFVDQDAAGAYLGKHGKYMEHLRNQHRGPPYIKVSGKLVRYSLADLRDWMYDRLERPES